MSGFWTCHECGAEMYGFENCQFCGAHKGGGRMSEYRPTEYVVDFGDCRSNRFVMLNMVLIKQNGAKLHERIVRCRDCVHYKPYRTHQHGMMNRCHDEHGNTHKRDETDFCSRGERRTNE